MATAGAGGSPPAHDGPDPDQEPPIRVLLVDDEVGYVDVLYRRLTKRGFGVGRAYAGGEALQILRREDFDVVLLDLKMADMDGIEVLKILKLLDPDMQVIMLTGHGSASALQQGFELGAYDYLMKPYSLEDLVLKVQAAFREKREATGE